MIDRTLITCEVPAEYLSMVASLTLELRIEHAQSLKDKRQLVRGFEERFHSTSR